MQPLQTTHQKQAYAPSQKPSSLCSLATFDDLTMRCTYFVRARITYEGLFEGWALELDCCKIQQKSSWPATGLWNRGPLKILNGIRLILDDQGNHLDSYTISLESFRSFRGPLFHKPVTVQELFFAVSCSKLTLAVGGSFFLELKGYATTRKICNTIASRNHNVIHENWQCAMV